MTAQNMYTYPRSKDGVEALRLCIRRNSINVGRQSYEKCARGFVREFPRIGCEEFESESGTDWRERERDGQ